MSDGVIGTYVNCQLTNGLIVSVEIDQCPLGHIVDWGQDGEGTAGLPVPITQNYSVNGVTIIPNWSTGGTTDNTGTINTTAPQVITALCYSDSYNDEWYTVVITGETICNTGFHTIGVIYGWDPINSSIFHIPKDEHAASVTTNIASVTTGGLAVHPDDRIAPTSENTSMENFMVAIGFVVCMATIIAAIVGAVLTLIKVWGEHEKEIKEHKVKIYKLQSLVDGLYAQAGQATKPAKPSRRK